MKFNISKTLSNFPNLVKYSVFCLFVAFFPLTKTKAQNRTLGSGGHSPNTKDIRTLFQSGDNKAFASGKNTSGHNDATYKSREEKKWIKQKQKIRSNFIGNDVRKKHSQKRHPHKFGR